MKGKLKRLAGTFLVLSLMVATSSCATMAQRSRSYPTKLPRVEGVKSVDCSVKGEDGKTTPRKCVVITQEDMAKILTEFAKACVALGNKIEDCGIKVQK